MRRRVTIGLAVLLAVASPPSFGTAPLWALDPTDPGGDLPPVGHSLFDEVAAGGVPFPFEALLTRIGERIGCAPEDCLDGVLIPLGRSLQRLAAAPDFFDSPRVVVAVTGEGTGPLYAKQRLFVGYQPRASLIEVISYNDAAGRFEFQLVRNYRADATPQVVHAERSVCVACHQNQAPIFSRPLWQETNANPGVAERLLDAGGDSGVVLGIKVSRGVDVPNAIDDATDGANLLAMTQRLWRDACDANCRMHAANAALEFRLSGGTHFEPVPGLAARFAELWPDGLAVPNPDVPNRDPFAVAHTSSSSSQSDVALQLDALQPRAPLETWAARDRWLERRFVIGLAAYLSNADLAALGRNREAARARLAAHSWPAGPIGHEVFREALGLPASPDWKHAPVAASSGPAPGDRNTTERVAERARAFAAPCGRCHATAETSPPNFLAGAPARVEAALAQCAPRIFVRLSMWQTPPEARQKVPMPPPRAAHAGRPFAQAEPDSGIADLQRTVAGWLAAERGRAPILAELLADGYERLRPCLPAGTLGNL